MLIPEDISTDATEMSMDEVREGYLESCAVELQSKQKQSCFDLGSSEVEIATRRLKSRSGSEVRSIIYIRPR